MRSQAEIERLILDRLKTDAPSLADQWNNPRGTRTRHVVIDDLLPPEVCREIADAFPLDGTGFTSRKTFRESKSTCAALADQAQILSDVTFAMQSPAVVSAIGGIIEIDGLEPDPRLYAGGLSMMYRGDFLNPHIDNSHDAARKRYRRLNLLYYVTPEWALDDGGHLELWDDAGRIPKALEARFNRLILMETNKHSLHSVCPVEALKPRRCVSNYYFSEQSPDASSYFHVTSFSGRPEQPLRRALAPFDNAARGAVAKALGGGRGRR